MNVINMGTTFTKQRLHGCIYRKLFNDFLSTLVLIMRQIIDLLGNGYVR
jgi:hypothetical protein